MWQEKISGAKNEGEILGRKLADIILKKQAGFNEE